MQNLKAGSRKNDTGIFAYLVDGNGVPLTEMTGKKEEVNRIFHAIGREQLQNLLMRVSESESEDRVIEFTHIPNLWLAAVCVKENGKAMATWIMCAVISDADCTGYIEPPLEGFERMLTEAEFYRTIDLMRENSQALLEYRCAAAEAQAENRRSQFSQREIEEILHRTEAMPEILQFLDHVGSAVYIRDKQTGSMLFANRIMQNIFRPGPENGAFDEFITKEMPSGGGSREVYHEASKCWYDLYYTDINWIDGRPVYLYAFYDITEKKGYQQKIEKQVYSDLLTGLCNRLCCERDLVRYIDEASNARAEGALLYLDLDDFKHINDGLGHQYGDVLLKAIANSLQKVCGIEDTCYRMGGDEFVIIVPVASYHMLDQILEDIKEIFAKPWFLKDADYYCTMSMGLACFPADGDNVHDLIKKADIAMYEAKKSGKNRHARYTAGTDFKSGKRLDMEKNMRDATVSGYREFEIYYQPIIDLQKEGMPCTGAEALIRWNSEAMGFVSPAEFIPLAEYLGLINPIGNYVLTEACKRCKYWNDNGYPGYKINVNLSVVQLLQPDIVRIVEQTIQETKINPANLTLEVTESLAINDMKRMKDILENIKKLGVRIALDDFGTGYSSLNHIREIPFDVIKVDQSFIKDLERDAYSRSFIKMVVQLAEAIDVNICIEGVETKEQYSILADMNVGLVQGYYFDQPLREEEFEGKYVPGL